MAAVMVGCQLRFINTTHQARSYTTSALVVRETDTFHQLRTRSMTPLKIQSTQRRTVPPPSAAMIAMWERGLELTLEDPSSPFPGSMDDPRGSSGSANQVPNPLTKSPADSHHTTSSSIYTTESARSRDSIETTISQIVDMYTDLINKIPFSYEDDATDVEILQPKAYRDTVAPLLQRRFSNERRSPSAPPPSSTSLPHGLHKRSTSSLRHAYQPPVGFREFTQNLRQRRADLVSPLGMYPSEYGEDTAIDVISEPSPIIAGLRTPSFTDSERDQLSDIQTCRSVSPILHQRTASMSEFVSQGATTATDSRLSYQSIAATQSPLSPESQWNSQRHRKRGEQSWQSSRDMRESSQLPDPQTESDRFYKHRSAEQLSSNRSVTYPAAGETMKARIRERIHWRRETKEKGTIAATAAQKYPFVKRESRKSTASSTDQKITNASADVGNSSRVSSSMQSPGDYSSFQPRSENKQPAVPLTAYQKYGTAAWSTENKEKRKDGSRRDRNTNRSQITPSLRLHAPSDMASKPRHRRTTSSKTDETADSEKSHGKRTGLINALHGAKNGLVSSSAEKRREKLKESIVVVGSAQLTHADAIASDKAIH